MKKIAEVIYSLFLLYGFVIFVATAIVFLLQFGAVLTGNEGLCSDKSRRIDHIIPARIITCWLFEEVKE